MYSSYSSLALAAIIAIRGVAGLEIPANVAAFRDSITKAGECSNKLASGLFASEEGTGTFSYCGDHLVDSKIVYLQGTGGALADMSIDCDGVQKGAGDDGRCGSSTDTQSQTSFQSQVNTFDPSVKDLNAFVHPYVVFGNVGSKEGFTNFDPTSAGIEPLSLMAVVCGDQMFYGIWGDENGDDGPKAVIGEASISLATLCFGTSITGNSGHGETDVLYIAFTGTDAAPGQNAKWNAGSVGEFSESIKSLGDTLVQRIGGGGVSSAERSKPTEAVKDVVVPTTLSTVIAKATEEPAVAGGADACEWVGHCAGASCSGMDDCDGELVCVSGKCGAGKR
ncbi:family 75 glycoside hydrolase [Amylocarpus encephaloides]|uniref:Endo-chitosanase n=1 Tax=Amylocarpus encephaloides TaxID=45428 RepID=A0A9P7YFS6_9HELO|nr:family 75 glycoside hydrolase [Amylocarpus encephaloides]